MRPNFPISAILALSTVPACSSPEMARFPLRPPLQQDDDVEPVYARCHAAPKPNDPSHVSCAPEPFDAPIYWDGMDNLFFRPLSETLGVVVSGEAQNVNSMDEVPDSSWFTNRLGTRAVSADELRSNGCSPSQLLDPDAATDGSWVIDQGKTSGSTPGFRVTVPGKGKYMVKVEATGLPERQVAATVIGEAVYYAVGYNATCEQALLVRPSVFSLKPGLRATHGNFGDEYDFDQKALDALFAKANKHGDRLRVSASAWLPGYVLQQFRYEGVRADDANDVVPHEDRRELRASRLVAAWIDYFDSREGNTLDTWIPAAKGAPADSSPGHVVHYLVGTSAALGSSWDWEPITRRLGYSYLLDWKDVGTDFVTLGSVPRRWDTVTRTPGREAFGYFNVRDFEPDQWKNEFPNPAFSRMTERDAAWMARILAHVTPTMIRALAEMGQFADPSNTDYLEAVLAGRLQKILARYLTRVSPIAEVRVEAGDTLCGRDLAEWRSLRQPEWFRYSARMLEHAALPVARRSAGEVCAALSHVAPDGRWPDDDVRRYVRVRIDDGVSRGPLIAHLYDLGPTRGYRLVGIERPDS